MLEEGAFDGVDADLLITGGDLIFGLRATPEAVRLRTGAGTGDSLDLANKAEVEDLTETGQEDDRYCEVVQQRTRKLESAILPRHVN